MATASDNFDRDNSASLGDNWTQTDGFIGIFSGQAAGSSAASNALAYYNAVVWDDYRQRASIRVKAVTCGVTVRHSATDCYLYAGVVGGPGSLYKRVGGTFTELSAITDVWAVDDDPELEVEDTALTCRLNTVVVHSQADSAVGTGALGIFTYDNNAILEDFVGESWASGVPSSNASAMLLMGVG